MTQPTLGIGDIIRASDVDRFTVLNVARRQSIAEHTFNVVMLVRAYCKLTDRDDVSLIKAALEHDLDEIRTGDIPTPVKLIMQEHDMDLRKLEGRMKNVHRLDISEIYILKAMDMLEAYRYLTHNGLGPSSKKAATWIYDRYKELLEASELSIEALSTIEHQIMSN